MPPSRSGHPGRDDPHRPGRADFPPVPSEEGSTGGSQKSGLPGRGNAVPGSPGIHMSERELENAIRRILADLPQVLWYHTRDSRRSPSGFPDLVCVGPGFVIYRELKTARGRVSAAQQRWLDALRDTGASAGCGGHRTCCPGRSRGNSPHWPG